MINYTFKHDCDLDYNLTKAWCEWDANDGQYTFSNWKEFLESLPGVVKAKHNTITACDDNTTLTFKDESDLSMFLLRWG